MEFVDVSPVDVIIMLPKKSTRRGGERSADVSYLVCIYVSSCDAKTSTG
jgi:hypothetical protein